MPLVKEDEAHYMGKIVADQVEDAISEDNGYKKKEWVAWCDLRPIIVKTVEEVISGAYGEDGNKA